MAGLGDLDKKVEIQQNQAIADADFNEPQENWVTLARRWCSIEPVEGREPTVAGQVTPDTLFIVTMRYYPVTSAMRLYWTTRERIFNIESAINPGEKRYGTLMTFKVREPGPQTEES